MMTNYDTSESPWIDEAENEQESEASSNETQTKRRCSDKNDAGRETPVETVGEARMAVTQRCSGCRRW